MTKLEKDENGKWSIVAKNWECLIFPRQEVIQTPRGRSKFNVIYREYQREEREFYLTEGGQDTGVLIEKDKSHTPSIVLERLYLALKIFKEIEELENL